MGALAPKASEADFLVLERDPTEDTKALRAIALRIKAGKEVTPVP